MMMTMTIENADTRLIDAIKSVVRLSPNATVTFEELSPLEESLLADRAEIRAQIADGTLQTYSTIEDYRKAHAL